MSELSTVCEHIACGVWPWLSPLL